MTVEQKEESPGFHIVGELDNVRWLTGLEFVHILPNNFKQYAQIKRWCENNCEDTVAFLCLSHYVSTERIYFFSGEDAIAFKLKWL